MNRKVVLIGDALAGLRPHSTVGTSQAAVNALLLKQVFEKSISIEDWGKQVLEFGTFASNVGVQLGTLSQYGKHPHADDGDE